MNPPIPPFTYANTCGAVGDLLRTAAAWGMADAKGEATDQHVQLIAQSVAQLLTIVFQREPTAEEMASVVGG